MRVHAFRMWFSARLHQGMGAARRAGMAISRKVRASLGKIEGASGIGDDETALGAGGSRAWWDAVEEAAARFREFLEKSTFVRIGKLEAWVRRKLGLPPRAGQAAALPAVTKVAPRRSDQRGSVPLDPEQAARLRAQVQLLRTQANTSRANAPVPPLRTSVPPPAPPTEARELHRSVETTDPAVRAVADEDTQDDGPSARGQDP